VRDSGQPSLASEGAELAGLDAGTLIADAIYMRAESASFGAECVELTHAVALTLRGCRCPYPAGSQRPAVAAFLCCCAARPGNHVDGPDGHLTRGLLGAPAGNWSCWSCERWRTGVAERG
jgi:hypothetical protein